MENDLDIEQIRCPGCGRQVDKLRAGAVAVYETKMVYYCTTECKTAHLGTLPSSPPPRRDSSDGRPSVKPQPPATPEPAEPQLQAKPSQAPISPDSRPSPLPRAPLSEPPEESGRSSNTSPVMEQPQGIPIAATSAAKIEPTVEPEPYVEPVLDEPEQQAVKPIQPPSVDAPLDESQSEVDGATGRIEIDTPDELPARTPRTRVITAVGLFLRLIVGFALFGLSFVASSSQHEFARELMVFVAAITVIWQLVTTIRAFPKRGWRAATEEGLVAVGALLLFIAGYLFPRAPGALLSVPGIVALTWAGRWFEAVMRDALVSRLRPMLDVEVDSREKVEAQLWGDWAQESIATRGWAEPAGAEPLGLPLEPKKSDILPQITATKGEGAAPIGRLAMRWVFFVGVLIALPVGLFALLALFFFTDDHDVALMLSASLVLALTPRGLRLGWMGPLLIAAGMGIRKGLLFRDGAALEATARAHRVVFDARGTLTMGEPTVTRVIQIGDLEEDQILALAAGVEEAAGNDPLGRAIVNAAEARRLSPVGVRLARQSPGLGMSATSPKGDLLVGTRQLILGQGISVAEADVVAGEMEGRAETVLFVALSGRIQGVIGLRDELRPGARDVASNILSQGVEPVLMTADSHLTADALGKTLGFDHIRSEVAPDQWSAQIQSMRETGQDVAMVTRPPRHEDTLAAANVGITLGRTGLKIESAGVAIEGDDPALAVKAVALARGALRTVRLNLLIAASLLVIVPGLASLFVNLLYYTQWIVPMVVAFVTSVAPALLCWDLISSPRRSRKR